MWRYFINKVSLWFEASLFMFTLVPLTGALSSIFLLVGWSAEFGEVLVVFMAVLL